MANWSVILNISKTHLLTKIKQTSIAALGVTFGIGSYITLVCFMTGLNTMLDDLILNQTPHVHIYNEIEPSKRQPISLYDTVEGSFNVVHSIRPKRSQKKIHNALPIIHYLESNPKVRAALPQVKTQIFYIAGSIELGGNITGIQPINEGKYFNMSDYIVEGSAEALETTDNSILLGIGIAEKMSLKVGDRVQVSPLNGGIFPLKIVGFYQSGIADLDAIQSFTTVKTIQRILGESKNYITDINIKLYDIEDAVPLANRIEQQFDLKAIDIKTANAQFETGTTIRNLITYAVSITLLIVAGFGIYNILNMLIYEKMNDIAILKATGFSGRDVQLIFMSQAMIIGFVGGILGLIIGYALATLIGTIPFETEALPTVETYPINMNPLFFVIGFTFAIFSTFLAGYLPSKRAKKIDPVRIIRGQ
ncbi:ABC transporter permease [Psychroserpens sp.]|uniref:ABC transporter permease n=1 Tax=Psychroserpens sp. TaxID=2020870 RepID=UPI001B1B01B3|nr:FtsX-like permease family protein [Psychroserpens sp.]MBO6607495.1 ABC transporter permease [Psychroserpens sp.]MBO6654427.1 ABC transporter permease [Psychroserpens sp.]MBO6681224.1 ABC transporter permease [Psychroserpens sp.]MBO6749819.1 ABC transporter permease [Psychroserpens sp.]MBO6916193.1 ABC transporter permease [Psychroserpens sp.]